MYKNECKMVLEDVCALVHADNIDNDHQTEVCTDVMHERCTPVPVKYEKQKCVSIPSQQCGNVPIVSSKSLPSKKCSFKPVKICQTVVSTKSIVSKKKIPKTICRNQESLGSSLFVRRNSDENNFKNQKVEAGKLRAQSSVDRFVFQVSLNDSRGEDISNDLVADSNNHINTRVHMKANLQEGYNTLNISSSENGSKYVPNNQILVDIKKVFSIVYQLNEDYYKKKLEYYHKQKYT